MAKKQNYEFVKVRCHHCSNEQVIFGRAATRVACKNCQERLARRRGGKAAVQGEMLQLY